MYSDEIKKIEEHESELAEKRAIDRKNGKLDTSNMRQIFRNLIHSGIFRNPRKERCKKK